MEKKEVINFENLEYYIKKIESIFKEENINPTEQSLILTQTLNRLNKKLKNQQAQDMVSNIPLGGLMKRLMKSKEEG